jgi:hypothetical protein
MRLVLLMAYQGVAVNLYMPTRLSCLNRSCAVHGLGMAHAIGGLRACRGTQPWSPSPLSAELSPLLFFVERGGVNKKANESKVLSLYSI